MKWAAAVVVMLLPLGGCSTSDRELVSDSLAARHYESGRLAKTCCQAGTGIWSDAENRVIPCATLSVEPPNCPAWKRDVNAFLDEVGLSNEAQKLGKLPKIARKRLKETKRQAEKEGAQ